MTGSIHAVIWIPIVAAVTLAFWIGSVFYADTHPDKKQETRQDSLRNTVSGGAFEASGGHQVMPHRDERPPEAEQYRERQQQEAGHGQRTLLPAGHR
ncbi:MAG TPA: hypothetical protein VH637_01015 [Streptosporangiaceae bacterium]|jgi:hypothetical protein